jgi:predicted AlkP superfamily pyrophosphatase or phosphodiesterase
MKNSVCLLFIILINVEFGTQASMTIGTKNRNPILLISLDGFRADKFDRFISENPDSNFAKFVREGVKAKYMK